MPTLTSTEAIALIQKAQSLPSAQAVAIITTLPQRTNPHPSLTNHVLDLLQIHPKETLPYIPDLLPPAEIPILLETLSALLSSDRTFLTPILGILPSLPLTPEQALHTRATVAFALDVVDKHDIPTVVRTLASMPSPWAAQTLRRRIRLTADIAPVVVEALSDILTPKNRLAETLLSPAPPPNALDILLLSKALQSRLSRPARKCVTKLTQAGTFSRCTYTNTIARIMTAFPSCIQGVTRFLTTVLSSARIEPVEIITITRFCKLVIKACPQAAIGITAARGFVARTVQSLLIADVDNARLRPNCLHRVPEIAVRSLAISDPPNWAPLFISVRKGALFGSTEDYLRVDRLSRAVVELADEEVVKELFDVLDGSIGECAAEPLVVMLLDLLGDALMRGIFIAKAFRKRLEKLPEGLFSTWRENGQDVMQVDIGTIWEQRPSVVANVVSSSVAMQLAERGIEGIARGLLDVSVLVPVVCITLYQANDDLADPIPLSTKGRRRSRAMETLPSNLLDLESSELGMAVSSFAVGMAAIVGLLNRSAKWSGCYRRVLEGRHGASIEKNDRKAMWMIVDRLTEVYRMRNASALAMEVLQRQWNSVRMPQKGADRSRRRKRETVSGVLERAQVVRDSVLAGLDGEESIRRRGHYDKEHKFPTFSLEAVVLSLIAIPDEAQIAKLGADTTTKQTRDMELVRIDKMLLFQLLRLMNSSSCSLGSNDGDDINLASNTKNIKTVDWSAQNFLNVDEIPPVRIEGAGPDPEKDLEEKDNIYLDEDMYDDDEAREEGDDNSTVLWAPKIGSSDNRDKAFVKSAVSFLLGKDETVHSRRQNNSATSIIYSPSFAALLLDRAATYVAIARNVRLSGGDDFFLSDIVMTAGLALGCLNVILRTVPMLPRFSDKVVDYEHSAGETEKMSCEFFNEMGKRLVVEVPPCIDAQKSPKILSKHLSEEGWKIIITLRWITNSSVEAAVASAALEGILAMSEYDVCQKSYARKLAFSSLTTVYEYEGRALWEETELDLLLRDTYMEWSSRRRRSQERMEANVDHLDAPDPYPWIDLKLKKLRRNLLERHRLLLYFSGMYVPDAMIEGCGWVREMLVALAYGMEIRNEESTVESSKTSDQEGRIAQRKSRKRRRGTVPRELIRKEVITCDTLLDMTGFRTVMELLIEIVVKGLQSYSVSVSLPMEDTNDEWTNPIPQLRNALRLFCGIVALHHENRQRLASASRDGTEHNIAPNLDFDYSVVTACIAVMQLTRRRIDELFAWYSNSCTIVSELSSDNMKCIEQVLGCASQAVNKCSAFSELVKAEPGIEENMDGTENRKRGTKARKTPGYETQPRKRVESAELSKARRMVPRLIGQAQNVENSLQKLARCIGVRARKTLGRLAPPPIASDSSLCFGVGLEQSIDDPDNSSSDQLEDSEAGRSKTTAGMSSDNGGNEPVLDIEGFHATGKTNLGGELEQTVKVSFRSSR